MTISAHGVRRISTEEESEEESVSEGVEDERIEIRSGSSEDSELVLGLLGIDWSVSNRARFVSMAGMRLGF